MITYELAVILGLIIEVIYIIISLFLKNSPQKIIITCVFIAYITALAIITLFPILIDEKVEYYGNTTWYNFVPFKTIRGALQYGINTTVLIQLLGNVIMTIPFGVIVLMLTKNHSWVKALVASIIFSSSIELSQLIIGCLINNMYRTVDIDDIILNVIGVYIGYGIFYLLPYRIKTYCRTKSRNP